MVLFSEKRSLFMHLCTIVNELFKVLLKECAKTKSSHFVISLI